MNNYKISWKIEIIILIIPKISLMKYFDYKWIWWLYNDSVTFEVKWIKVWWFSSLLKSTSYNNVGKATFVDPFRCKFIGSCIWCHWF